MSISIGSPLFDGGSSKGPRTIYRESSIRTVVHSFHHEGNASASLRRGVVVKGNNDDGMNSTLHSFVEDELQPREESFSLSASDNTIGCSIMQGIPASLIVAQHLVCNDGFSLTGGAGPSDKSWWSRRENATEAFDFTGACANILTALEETARQGDTIEVVLEIEYCPMPSTTSCSWGETQSGGRRKNDNVKLILKDIIVAGGDQALCR